MPHSSNGDKSDENACSGTGGKILIKESDGIRAWLEGDLRLAIRLFINPR